MANPIPTPAAGPVAGPKRFTQRGAGHPKNKTTNKTKVGGGFNPSVNLTLVKGATGNSGQPAAGGAADSKIPGSDFMSNEDIRAWCEYIRKEGRRAGIERTLDAEHLETVLKHIRDANGSMAGAAMRARRVSRWAKRIAKAEAAKAKSAAALYAQFEREFDSNLRQVGKGRPKKPTIGFAWN